MTTIIHPSPLPTPSSSAPPTPPYPAFPRLPGGSPGISRNASTSSSRSDNTISSTTSSLVAAPIRPPPIETRTAATGAAQLSSRPGSADTTVHRHGPNHKSGPGSAGSTSPGWGGRGMMRNGPRSRSTLPPAPTITTSSPSPDPPHITPERPTAPVEEWSPTTPRAPRWSSPSPESDVPPRVTVSMDPTDGPSRARGRDGKWSTPSSPTIGKSPRSKHRTLSVDGRTEDTDRERRQSMASAHSSASNGGPKKPSLKDFVLGEELGRGSYSTVVQATSAISAQPSSSPRSPRQYAIKIINQAHLVAEKKVKYALIERDALIRLAMPSKDGARGHRRGVSSSSSAGTATTAKRRMSAASIGSVTGAPRRETTTPSTRLTVSTDVSNVGGGPSSPVNWSTLAGRRPSRSAEPPEMVPERSEENVLESPVEGLRSKPPSPVKEESGEYHHETTPKRNSTRMEDSPIVTTAPPTPDMSGEKKQRTRRTSLAPSEKSVKSSRGTVAHPGVIRLHSTFNDNTSLYFVLDLAKNGELLTFVRKFGSLDIDSARYYAAQLIDTIEFMQERGVIHRDLKPENILLDDDMRTKITDFGSAKIVGKDGDIAQEEDRKRSFVGSADFVSPEVLRNEPAVFASDIWAFGCILYQLLIGKPPFRGATDYLTFQKILKRDMEYPDGLDEEAQALIELVLNLEPIARPSPAEIKNHPFFSTVDFSSIWQITAPTITTGLKKPITTNATTTPDADIWAVFDDEVSDGGFEYDDAEAPQNGQVDLTEDANRREAPVFDHHAARQAVQSVDHAHTRHDSSESLEPPKPAYMEGKRKGRGWSTSSRSARTSSSSSHNRTALTGLLENMGLVHTNTSSTGTPSTSVSATSGGTPRGSTRTSRTSDRMEESKTIPPPPGDDKWSSLLLANERILLSTPINVRPSPGGSMIPAFLLSTGKRRHLILTDFPRLIEVKDDSEGPGPRVKFEAVLLRQPSERPDDNPNSSHGTGVNRVVDVVEKGSKGFVVNTVNSSVLYHADSTDVRNQWISTIRGTSV